MKLLFDQNLSPKLVAKLADIFPGASHVQSVGLDNADDEKIWEFARLNGFTVVTKDEDYSALSVMRGVPPKVVWLQLGNCTTGEIEAAFRTRLSDIQHFDSDLSLGILILR